MLTLGIDPGFAILGYAVVQGTKEKPVCLDFGVVKTDLPNLPERLVQIAQDLELLIEKYQPQQAVVEQLFFFKNQKTAMDVAQSRGVVLYLLAKHKIDIIQVTPMQVKQTVCGYGKASKQQVQKMMQKIFNLESLPKPDDAADSLAIAWCGL